MANKNKTTVKQYKLKDGVKIEAVKINFPKNQIEVAAWLGKLRKEGVNMPEVEFPTYREGLFVWFDGATDSGTFCENGTYLMRIGDMFVWGMPDNKIIKHNFEKICKD